MVAGKKSEGKLSEAAQRLKKMRERAGYGLREFARLVDMPVNSYRHYESRLKERYQPMELVEKARPHLSARGIPDAEIMGLAGAEVRERSMGEAEELPAAPSGHIETGWSLPLMTNKRVPLYRMRVTGGTGSFELDWENTLGALAATSALALMGDVYALIVDGTTMEPRYYANERVYVTKSRPPSVGWFAVVRMNDQNPVQKCYLLRLVERTDTKIICEQLNPIKRFTFNPELVELDRVLLSNEIDGS